VEASEALFVGDTWGPDVEGPRAAGIRAAYLRREGHWPDGTCPHDEPATTRTPVIPDLRGLLDLVESAAVP
jgi:putative hydrolase of the HAD superfamily